MQVQDEFIAEITDIIQKILQDELKKASKKQASVNQIVAKNDDFFLQEGILKAETEIKAGIEKIKALAVVSQEAYNQITLSYNVAKDWEKKIEAQRKALNEPAQAEINARNDRARQITSLLKQMQGIANIKAAEYTQLLEEKKAQEQAQQQEAADLLDLPDPISLPDEGPVRGQGAAAVTVKKTKWRIIDESAIPRKYLTINSDLVDRDVKLGVFSIPGIEIYEEKTTTLRKR